MGLVQALYKWITISGKELPNCIKGHENCVDTNTKERSI